MYTVKAAIVLSIILFFIALVPLCAPAVVLPGIFGVVLGIIAIIEAAKNKNPLMKASIVTTLCAVSTIMGVSNFDKFVDELGAMSVKAVAPVFSELTHKKSYNQGYNQGFKDGVDAGIEAGARRGVDITPNLNMRAIENGILNSNSQ